MRRDSESVDAVERGRTTRAPASSSAVIRAAGSNPSPLEKAHNPVHLTLVRFATRQSPFSRVVESPPRHRVVFTLGWRRKPTIATHRPTATYRWSLNHRNTPSDGYISLVGLAQTPVTVVGMAGHFVPTCSGPDGPPQTVLRRPFGRAADTTAAATLGTISWDK